MKNTHTRPIAGLYRKSALALMTAGTLMAISGNCTHASADPFKKDFDRLRYDDHHDGGKSCDPPAAPEVATWCMGGAVLSIGALGQARRKWLSGRQTASH
jgi:hypothetical protein